MHAILASAARPSRRRLLLLLLAAASIVLYVLGFHEAAGVAPAMAVGTGAEYLKNLPAPNTYKIDAVAFARETSRNRKTNPAVTFTAYGQKKGQKIDATGVVGRIILLVEATLTNGATAPTVTSQWPWNLLKNVTVAANGINNLFSCDGIDLRALARVRNPFFFDRQVDFDVTGASAANEIKLQYEIPLAFDDESLMGAVFAQTQDTSLSWSVELAASADLFSANAPTLTSCSITAVTEFYSIPYEDVSGHRIAVIPDLRRMHGFYAATHALASTTYSPLMRVPGVLARIFQRIDNAANAAGDGNWATLCTSHKFQYGSNVEPYDVPGIVLRHENEKDYGDQLLPTADAVSGNVGYVVDDLVRDNALRDVIHLMGVTQPQIINVFSGLTISNGNDSVVRTVQEHMVAGA